MGDRKGDQQARAELLAEMLSSIGRKPSLLRYGTGREVWYLVLLKATDAELQAYAKVLGAAPPTVKAGPFRYLALSVEKDAAPGQVDAKYYDAAASRWTGTVAIQRYE
ncbi:MAG: hypothetical protein FJ221_18615 [Lentisphaerae bacterium]|nr:hypothetical protein [Lentisphaerota bacterium]